MAQNNYSSNSQLKSILSWKTSARMKWNIVFLLDLIDRVDCHVVGLLNHNYFAFLAADDSAAECVHLPDEPHVGTDRPRMWHSAQSVSDWSLAVEAFAVWKWYKDIFDHMVIQHMRTKDSNE